MGMVPPTFRVYLPSSAKVLRKCPHRHVQLRISQVTLNPVKRTVRTKHHIRSGTEFSMYGIISAREEFLIWGCFRV